MKDFCDKNGFFDTDVLNDKCQQHTINVFCVPDNWVLTIYL